LRKNTRTSIAPHRPSRLFFSGAAFFCTPSILRVMDPVYSFDFFHILD
jgi:hypothetical protein